MTSNEDQELRRKLSSAFVDMPQQFAVEAGAVQRAVTKRRRRGRALVGVLSVVALAAAGGLAWTQLDQRNEGAQPIAGPVILRSSAALEAYSSSTARDWVATADVVVVAMVSEEKPGMTSEADDGTGDNFIDRSVTLQVMQQLWSRPGGAGLEDGDAVEVSAYGSVAHSDGSTSRLAAVGTPRLEKGHKYLVALVNQDCPTSQDEASLAWTTLGNEAVIPADDDQIGHGESEGRSVDGDPDQSRVGSLERELLGKAPDDAIGRLKAAQSQVQDVATPNVEAC